MYLTTVLLPFPWGLKCSDLDLSHNKFSTFLPSADQFWNQSLKHLNLSHNFMHDLAESILRLNQLTYLNVSHNLISTLPAQEVWQCELVTLHIDHNRLGHIPGNAISVPCVEFPGTLLSKSLLELNLSHNELKQVPEGVCEMTRLSSLDLSFNTELKSLPEELGLLKKILVLKLDGVKLKDKTLQNLVNAPDDPHNFKVIQYLEKKLKKCVAWKTIKVVVLGCKHDEDHCTFRSLAKINEKLGAGNNFVDKIRECVLPIAQEKESLSVTHWKIKKNCWTVWPVFEKLQHPSISFEVWEFPDTKITSTILPCFLTLNSLYVIMHYVSSNDKNCKIISERISSIQACVHSPQIIVICIYAQEKDFTRLDKNFKKEVEKENIQARFISVFLDSDFSSDFFLKEILATCEKMNDNTLDYDFPLIKRKIPSVFKKVAENTKSLKKCTNICLLEQFCNYTDCTKKDLEDGVDQNLTMHEFLLQSGAILHYNYYSEELSACVVTNPVWLFDILSHFLKTLSERRYPKAHVSICEVKEVIEDRLPEEYFTAFLLLLEAFNIGIRTTDNEGNKILLVPSMLSPNPPQLQLSPHHDGYRASRLYPLPAIPSALWSHIISQLIPAFERFSSPEWNLDDRHYVERENRNRSFIINSRISNFRGLHIMHPNIQYWRTGLIVSHDEGYVVVEEVKCSSQRSEIDGKVGILVTVQTNGCNASNSHIINLRKLATIGIVTYELEDIIELFYPRFRDTTESSLSPLALCQRCCKTQPLSGIFKAPDPHYSFSYCAQLVLSHENVTCQMGLTSLDTLVPELYFCELPPEHHIQFDDLKLLDKKLGEGIAGTVLSAKYRDKEVAVKVFHIPSINPDSHYVADEVYRNIGKLNESRMWATDELVQLEQSNVCSAFLHLRREVSVLSKLNYKCIVAFIGVCIKPQLLMVMELAPLGSLRLQLGEGFTPDSSNKTISKTVFTKDLTYKILLQVVCGLSYLHKNHIIYRDLKPDNILVMSLDVDAPINVKLSDYGISKFSTLRGISGLFGTVEYMAPEVMSKQPYSSKVDIYSYGIVTLEILTGISPMMVENQCMMLLKDKVQDDDSPSQIKGYKIKCHFPCVEDLMKYCWRFKMEDRPCADDIIKHMKSDQFLLLHDTVSVEMKSEIEITCVYTCQTNGSWNIWISESGPVKDRYFSVYNVESACFVAEREKMPGNTVISMAKVGSNIWLACQDQKVLQYLKRGRTSKFEISDEKILAGQPRIIKTHYFDHQKESECLAMIGFENGMVSTYYFKNPHTSSYTISTDFRFDNTPIYDICSATSHLIAVACDMKIYFLLATPEEVHERGTIMPQLTNDGSLSINTTMALGCNMPVMSMTTDNTYLWCCLEFASCVIKIDIKLREIVLVFSLSWDSTRDSARLEQEQVERPNNIRQTTSDSGATSHTTDRRQTSDSGATSHTFERRQTSDSGTTSHTFERRQTSDGGTLYENNDEVFQSEDATSSPLLPLRHFPSMPLLANPPAVPRNPSHQEELLFPTSLIVSSDVLVLGTNCGGLLLLPLDYTQLSLDNQLISLQIPVLRHPHKGDRHWKKAKGLSEVSCSSTRGSISSLFLANEKLVSVHSNSENVCLRPKKQRRTKSEDRHRNAVFIGNLLPDTQHQQTDAQPAGVHHVTMPGPEGGRQNRSTTGSVADIALWDKISSDRLKCVRKFHQDFP
ncbi:leucine-rich repeat serine/threonine-protein kinase 1-like isoform X2 [Physella acuta]|uniref:leucine-rich repeat serine/threonine-protein kinase 1-like isoform X2 n=1 Tax=Physella acuta TaxID=109671 RepID=UPI0027DE3911|nr:leucine-rich repeat serine/threonine-protein kinase 1-like isoform X2 [Physella acuta]